LDNELALYRVIQIVPYSLIKASGTEVEQYLNEPFLKRGDKKTYSEYWKGASTFYLILTRMAKDYGTILSTSVPSESVFSIAGLQITARRNRLAPKTMGVIMCLRSWGLISENDDDEDRDSDEEDIRKDRGLGRMVELDEVILSSQPQ
jgi:hAT family C-terminal dimerisation region